MLRNILILIGITIFIIGCNKDDENLPINTDNNIHRFVGIWNLQQHNIVTLDDSLLTEGNFEATLDIRNNGVFYRDGTFIGNFYWAESLEGGAIIITSEFDNNDGTFFITTKRYNIEIDEEDLQFWKTKDEFTDFNTNKLYRSVEEWRLERQ